MWKIAAVTGIGAFMAMLDSTVANLAVESIRSDFQTSLPLVQWIVTGYLIALVVSLPATGWLGSRFGHGRIWVGSLGVFVAASALCGIAPGPGTLIGARVLQGLAAGVLVPSGQAVIGATAGPAQLGRIFGLLGFVIALGPAVGPPIGGFLLVVASWRWLFWINIPLGLVALICAKSLVPLGDPSGERPLDWLGLILLGTGLPLILYGATGWTDGEIAPSDLLSTVLGLALSAAFVFSTRRSINPLINLRLLRRRVFAAPTVTAGLTAMNMYGGLLLIPLFLQLIAERNAAETGALLFAMGLGSALVLPAAGLLTDRYGARVVILVGAGLLLMSTVPFFLPGGGSTAVLTVALLLRGIGLAAAQMPAMTAAYGVVQSEQMGDAATLVNILQRVGGALGAIAVAVTLAQEPEATTSHGYMLAFGGIVAISLATLGIAVTLPAGPLDQQAGPHGKGSPK